MARNERYRLTNEKDPCAGRLKIDKLGNVQATLDGQAVFDMLWEDGYRYSGDEPETPKDARSAELFFMPRRRARK